MKKSYKWKNLVPTLVIIIVSYCVIFVYTSTLIRFSSTVQLVFVRTHANFVVICLRTQLVCNSLFTRAFEKRIWAFFLGRCFVFLVIFMGFLSKFEDFKGKKGTIYDLFGIFLWILYICLVFNEGEQLCNVFWGFLLPFVIFL